MLRLALTGPHGVGKTTLITVLARRISERGRVIACREAPRLIADQVGDPLFFRRENNQLSRQALIFLEHVMEERRAAADADVVLSDRTLVDHLAYTEALFPYSVDTPEVRTYRRLAMESLAFYDAIFQLPIEFAPVDDGVREADLAFQQQIGDTITALYAAAGVKPLIVRGSVAERAAQIEHHLASLFPR
jgi:predicted ATPase